MGCERFAESHAPLGACASSHASICAIAAPWFPRSDEARTRTTHMRCPNMRQFVGPIRLSLRSQRAKKVNIARMSPQRAPIGCDREWPGRFGSSRAGSAVRKWVHPFRSTFSHLTCALGGHFCQCALFESKSHLVCVRKLAVCK